MKLNEFASEREQQKLDELLPAVGAGLAALARGGAAAAKGIGSLAAKGAQAAGQAVKSVGQAASNAASSVGSNVAKAAGNVATATGGGEIGPIDIINAIKDPKVSQQLKVLKQKMPGSDLDAMVDPKAAQDQQKQIQNIDKAIQDLKKNAGLK